MGYEKFVMDADQAGMMHTLLAGVDLSENGQALDAIREVGPGKHFLGCAHTQANFQTAFYRSPLADNNSVEQWEAEGAKDMTQRANALVEEAARRIRSAARSIRPWTRRSTTTSTAARPRSPTPTSSAARRSAQTRAGRPRSPRAHPPAQMPGPGQPQRTAGALTHSGAGGRAHRRAGRPLLPAAAARPCSDSKRRPWSAGCPSPRRSAPEISARSPFRSSPPAAPDPRSSCVRTCPAARCARRCRQRYRPRRPAKDRSPGSCRGPWRISRRCDCRRRRRGGCARPASRPGGPSSSCTPAYSAALAS